MAEEACLADRSPLTKRDAVCPRCFVLCLYEYAVAALCGCVWLCGCAGCGCVWLYQALRLCPGHPLAELVRAEQLESAAMVTEAVAQYRKAISVQPSFTAYQGLLARRTALMVVLCA